MSFRKFRKGSRFCIFLVLASSRADRASFIRKMYLRKAYWNEHEGSKYSMNSPRFNTFVLTRSLPDRLSGIEGTAEPALFRSSEKRTKHYVVGCLLALRTLWVGGWEFHRENRDRVWCRVIWFHDLPTEENEPANSGQLVQVRKQSGPRDTDCLDAKLWTRDTRRGVRPIGWTKDVSLHPLSLSRCRSTNGR